MLRVLGEACVDGAPALAGRSRRVLLAALTLDAPSPVSCDRLVHLLWGDDSPRHPAAALQNHVSRLRKELPADLRVVSVGDAYRLEVTDDAVDARVLSAALGTVQGRPAAERLRAVDHALSLWRGTPYADLDDDRAAAQRERLHQLRAALIDVRAEALLDAGRLAEAVADLEAARDRDPLRERTVALLMRAYVRAGRRADALEAYRRLRHRVVEELGLDPSPALRALELAIVTDELVADPPAGPPPVPSLPVPVSSLVGRDEDLAAARAVLDEGHRLLTLVGPGGVGKSRLALHLLGGTGADRPAGPPPVLVELAPLRHPADLPDLVASTLGVPHGAGGSALERVVDALAAGPHLLLVDNCEHVVDACAAFVQAVLTRTRHVVVVATSRESLRVDGERVVEVRPLGTEYAVALLVDRARAVLGELPEHEGTRGLLVTLCEALDRLPLALELAAARLSTTTLPELVAGLGSRLTMLDGGHRTAAPRHRSLRSLVEWSVRDLDHELRTTFARLSVMAAPATVVDAAVVCDEPEPVVAARLAELTQRSLLVAHRRAGGATRYGFLETVRVYAADLLAAGDDAAQVRDRHAAWVLDLVARASDGAVAHDPTGGSLDRLAEVRVAHRWLHARDDADRALRLAAGLHHLALFRMQAEVFGWITETAVRYGDHPSPDAERVLASASIGAWQRGDLGGARELAARAVAVGRLGGWPAAGAGGAECTGDVLGFSGDLEGSLRCWEHAVAAARHGAPARLVADLADGAMVASYVGRWDLADAWAGEARALLGAEESWLSAWVDHAEGEALADRDPARALVLLGRAMEAARRTSADFVVGVAGLTWVGLQVRHGDPAAATSEMVRLLERWRRGDAWVQLSIALRTCVELLAVLGDDEGAAMLLGAVDGGRAGGAVVGEDRRRLDAVREQVLAGRGDLDAVVARGARASRDEVLDHVLSRLRARDDSPAGGP